MARFTWNPSFGAQSAREPRIRSARFGDGYEQRAASGLNADLATWSLTFENRSDADAASITAFLAARGGHEAFEWIAPGDTVTVVDHGFGVGDGTTTAFQLQATKNGEQSDVLGTWPAYTKPRTNHCTRSEPTIAQLSAKSATVTDSAAPSPFTGNAVQYPAAAQNDWGYVAGAAGVVNPVVSAFVKMADGSAPVLSGSSSTGDFCLAVQGGGALATQNLTVTSIGGGIYRVSGRWIGTVSSTSFGIYRFAAQSGKAFQVMGFQMEADNGTGLPTRYIPTASAAVTVNPAYWPASGDGFEPITEPAPGATLYMEDAFGKRQIHPTARTNHCTRSEPTIAQLSAKSATVTDSAAPSPFTGNAIQIPAAVQNDYAYVNGATGILNPIVSVFVKMADGSAPVLGGSSTQGDFLLVVNSGANPATQNLTVTPIGGGLYRVSARRIGTTTSTGFGLFRYTTQSGKGFQVMGFQMEADNGTGLPTGYIPTTGTAATRTDYTLGPKGAVTMGVAPASGAVLSWTGTGSWVKSWVCRRWNRRVPNYGVATVTADFEQVPA